MGGVLGSARSADITRKSSPLTATRVHRAKARATGGAKEPMTPRPLLAAGDGAYESFIGKQRVCVFAPERPSNCIAGRYFMFVLTNLVPIILFMSERAACFHTKCSGRVSSCPRFRHRAYGASPHRREEQLREEAADALLPVLFPESRRSSISPYGNSPAAGESITAETALKRLLRKKYHHRKFDSNRSRSRLAALILGTGVMRLRHWYVVSRQSNGMLQGSDLPLPNPLDSSLLSLIPAASATDGGANDSFERAISDGHNNSTEGVERSLARAMVDEHARYLSTSDRTLRISQPNSFCNNTAVSLSIEFSLPYFLSSSLLSEYGFEHTKQMCHLMNEPGPISLRRNAIRFPGSDEDLCEWLRKEDGIHAEPLVACLKGGLTTMHSKPIMTVSSDGSNRYVVGSLSNSDSILPPEGTMRISRERRGPKSIWSMKGWKNGYFEVQDAGSQIIVQSMEVSPGECILDYCAGNGGKTFALASAIMSAASNLRHCQKATDTSVFSSRIVAHDVVEERLRQIQGSLPRVGFSAQEGGGTSDAIHSALNSRGDCECTIQIATSSGLETSLNSTSPCHFDAVLVDAPCSSTGVLRRRPSQRWDLTEEQIFESLPKLQLEVLRKAASFVNENGGKLVYSTCSLVPEENEEVVKEFERVFLSGGFERWEFAPVVSENEGEDLTKEARGNSEKKHTLTLLPSQNGSDGFFIARWKRCTKK